VYLNSSAGFDGRNLAILPFSRGREETDPELPRHVGDAFLHAGEVAKVVSAPAHSSKAATSELETITETPGEHVSAPADSSKAASSEPEPSTDTLANSTDAQGPEHAGAASVEKSDAVEASTEKQVASKAKAAAPQAAAQWKPDPKEKRRDPTDGGCYTYAQIKNHYKGTYSEAECLDWWFNNCKKI
jgi:hypothetical protein